MKIRAAIMNDQTPILLLNWTILTTKHEYTPLTNDFVKAGI